MSIVVTSTQAPKEQAPAPAAEQASLANVDETKVSSEQSPDTEGTDSKETLESKGLEQDGKQDQPTPEDRPKKKSGIQRLKEKHAREMSEAMRRIQALEQGHSVQPEEKTAQAPVIEGRPKEESFETHAEYVEALADWKVEQKLKERDNKAKEAQVKTEFQRQVESHQKRIAAFAKEHSDFSEVLEDVDDVPMSITVQQVILESDNGPALMYELAKDRAEFERICGLSPIAAAREMGKIEARIAKSLDEKSRPEVKTTKAPPPPKPVGSTGQAGTKSIYDPNLSQAEYERIRKEQMAKKASAWG